ncbi:MAG: hypothetical protein U1F56_06095 [Rubrivivax sp.]
MKLGIGLDLPLTTEQSQRLRRLQALFAQACNLVAPIAREHRCWNRVALHHLTYREVRKAFPQLGSQMACNAIYAVSRASRLVYQGPRSPFNVRLVGASPLPLIRFMPEAPVYFDRHTLALRDGKVSLFTLEGRIHCPVSVTPQQHRHLTEGRIEEIALHCRDGRHGLDFRVESDALSDRRAALARKMPAALPDHVVIQPAADTASGANPAQLS